MAAGGEDDKVVLSDSKVGEYWDHQKWTRRREWIPLVRSQARVRHHSGGAPFIFNLGRNIELVVGSERE